MSTQSDLAELYTTFFDRAPDAGGLAYWVAQVDGGQITLAQVAENWLTQQPEGLSNFPSTLTDAQFIEAVYNNLLGRAADTGGAQYWLQQLQSGAVPRDSFALTLINGAKANTSAQGLQDAALINNKATIGVEFAAKGLNDLSLASAIVQSVTADANTLTATQAILGLIPSTTAGQTTAILTAANQLLTKLTALITAAPGEVADANTYLNALLSGATSNTDLVTLLNNANTLLTSAATDSAALDNPATKGAADVVTATPTSGGGGSTPATFTATVDVNGELSFGGTATGNITVATTNGDVVFTRGGVDAATVTLNSIQSIAGAAPIVLDKLQFLIFSQASVLAPTNNITINDNSLTAAEIATYGPDANLTSIRVASASLTLTQYNSASAKLNAADSITVNDNNLTGAQIATLGADVKVDSIRAATQTLTQAQYTAASTKLNIADSITVDDNTLTGVQILALEGDNKVDSIVTASAVLTLAQYGAITSKLNASAITINDNSLTAVQIATLGADANVDFIRAATQTLTLAQYTAAAAKLDAADSITVNDPALTAAQVATLGADVTVDNIRVPSAVLDLAQYTAAAAKLNVADNITVNDNTLTAAQIATLGAAANVDSIRAATQTLTQLQYTAAAAKLNIADSITINDNSLTAAQIAVFGADAKVDGIRAAIQTLTQAQYTAASAKLDAADSITVNDNTLTAAQIATLGADVKVDSIRAVTQTLNKTQYAAASAKLNAADSITVVDNTLTAAEVAILGADAKVDDIGVTPLTLDATQFTAAGAKLRLEDTITISDTGTAISAAIAFITTEASVVDVIKANDSTPITLTAAQFSGITAAKFDELDTIVIADSSANIQTNLASLLGNDKVDTIDSTEDGVAINLSAEQATSDNLAKLVDGDTINVVGTGAELQAVLTTLVSLQPAELSKIDSINSSNNQLTLTAAQAVALGAKLTDATDVITITNSLLQGTLTVASGAFQSGNDKLQFVAAALTGTSGFVSYTGSNTKITFAGGEAELVVGTAGTLVASSAQATFLFDTATGALSYDADGTAGTAAIPVVTLTGVNTLAVGDFTFAPV